MSDLIIKKNGTDYKLPMLAEHYPADRVYLDGDTSKTVQDAINTLKESNVEISAGGTQIPNGVYTTVTAEKDGYLSVYSTNTDTTVLIAISGDTSVLAIAKPTSSSEWAYTNAYVRKGESVAVRANGTHGYYRFHYFSKS